MLASHYYEGKIEAGCDEAGRGCLAGSVYAAAVILPDDYQNDLLNDSKQLTEKRRYQLREIIQRDAIAWAVGIVTPEEIDKINILNGIVSSHISKSLTPPSSRATESISPSLQQAFLPRPTETTT